MCNLLKATCNNKPTQITYNKNVILKLAALSLATNKLSTNVYNGLLDSKINYPVSFGVLGVELVNEKDFNLAESYNWQLNTFKVDYKGVMECYISWVVEHKGTVALGLTEVFYLKLSELEVIKL